LLVELFPRPLHDDDRAAAHECAGDAVDHISWIGDVMEGGGGDRIDLRRKFGALELDPSVVPAGGAGSRPRTSGHSVASQRSPGVIFRSWDEVETGVHRSQSD
jgi:hypothetical protein